MKFELDPKMMGYVSMRTSMISMISGKDLWVA